MADKVIAIPGVGNIAFPDSMSESEINAASAKLFQEKQGATSLGVQVEGSPVERFVGGVWKNINPVSAVTGLAHAVMHPVDTATNIVGAQGAELAKAKENFTQGRYNEALGHAAAGVLPVIGPAAAAAGERIGSGDIAGGLGESAGLLVPYAASAGAEALQRLKPAGMAVGDARKATMLEREAQQQVAQNVLAPGNPKFKGKAQAIAPEILARKMTGDRAMLAQLAEEGMDEAGSRIDAANTAAGGAQAPIPVKNIIGRLNARIDDLSVGGAPKVGMEGRVQALQQQIEQLRRTATANVPAWQRPVNPTIPHAELRSIRDTNYELADQARAYERAGNPIHSDQGFAARETGSAIRQEFAAHSPEAAAANADFTFYKTLSDILDPIQGRPKATGLPTGVTGGARVSSAMLGGLLGPKAAFVMGSVIPWLKELRASPGYQMVSAQKKMDLAQAIRSGQTGRATSIMRQITRSLPVGITSGEAGAAAVPGGRTAEGQP